LNSVQVPSGATDQARLIAVQATNATISPKPSQAQRDASTRRLPPSSQAPQATSAITARATCRRFSSGICAAPWKKTP